MKSHRTIGVFGRWLAALCATAVVAAPASAVADEYTNEASNPFRIAYYFVYPVGKFLEYTVTRPLHAASQEAAPFHHIDEKRPNGCSRERPSRDCTRAIR